jgi:hypothetical protein
MRALKMALRKYLQSEIKSMYRNGELKKITSRNKAGDTAIHTDGLTQIGFNAGAYGCNAEIYQDDKTGELFINNFRINLPKN